MKRRNEHIPAWMSVCVRVPVHTCARVCVHVCPCGCVVPTFLAQTVACWSHFSQPCLSYETTHPGGSAGQHAEGSPLLTTPHGPPVCGRARYPSLSPGHPHGARPQCGWGSPGLPPARGPTPHPSGKPACGAGGRRAEGSRVSASRGRTSRRGLGAWPLSCCTHRPVCEARAGAVRHVSVFTRGGWPLPSAGITVLGPVARMQIPDPEQQRSLNTWECGKMLSGGGIRDLGSGPSSLSPKRARDLDRAFESHGPRPTRRENKPQAGVQRSHSRGGGWVCDIRVGQTGGSAPVGRGPLHPQPPPAPALLPVKVGPASRPL